MTLVSKSFDTCCKAFTEDRRRCRLSCLSGKNTCRIHKNYFTNWFQKHGYLSLEQMENRNSRKFREFNFVISNKFIQIPELYVRDIPLLDDYVPFYVWLCKHGADPFWNLQCFMKTINVTVDNVFTNFFCRNILVTEAPRYIQIFNNLFITNEYKKEGLKYIILYTFYKAIHLYNIYIDEDGRNNVVLSSTSFLNDMLTYIDYKTLLFNDLSYIIDDVKRILLIDHDAHIIDFFMNTIILGSIEETKQGTKNDLRNRCNIFKEELMAYVYYPDRIFTLINKYGMNILDDY